MKAFLLSSLSKVFKDVEPNEAEFNAFSSLSNENFSFQIAVLPEKESETTLSVKVSSPIADDITVYEVKNIPAGTTQYEDSDNFHYSAEIKEFPDLLMPVDGDVTLAKDEWTSLWFEYKPTKKAVGTHTITVKLTAGDVAEEKSFNLEVIDSELPKQEILFTNWFHNDCICTYYNIEPFSDEYWEIVERFIKNAREHGVNMLLTPVFTPPLDTAVGGERPTFQLVGAKKQGDTYSFDFANFRKYVDICLKKSMLLKLLLTLTVKASVFSDGKPKQAVKNTQASSSSFPKPSAKKRKTLELKSVAGFTFLTSLMKTRLSNTLKPLILLKSILRISILLTRFQIYVISETGLLKHPFAQKMKQTFSEQRSQISGRITVAHKPKSIFPTECLHSPLHVTEF